MFDGFELDGEWDDQQIYREEPGCKSDRPRRLSHCRDTAGAHSAFSQLVGVVDGLAYMHKLHVVHGDLKGVRNRSVRPPARRCNDKTLGKRPREPKPSCLSRRLWPFYHRQCGHLPGSNPLGCEPEGLFDVLHLRGELSVDESRTSGPE